MLKKEKISRAHRILARSALHRVDRTGAVSNARMATEIAESKHEELKLLLHGYTPVLNPVAFGSVLSG